MIHPIDLKYQTKPRQQICRKHNESYASNVFLLLYHIPLGIVNCQIVDLIITIRNIFSEVIMKARDIIFETINIGKMIFFNKEL